MSGLSIQKQIISAVFGHFEAAAQLFDLVLRLIRAQGEQQAEYLRCFLADIRPDDLGIPDINAFFLSIDSNQPSGSIRDLEDRIVDGLIRSNADEVEFYRVLAQRLFDVTLIPSEEERRDLLMLLWIDVRIPYFRLDQGCVMTDERYIELQKEIDPQLKKAKHILFRWDLQKTQQSSLLVALSRSIEDEERQAVFWATALSTYAVFFSSMLNREEAEAQEQEGTD